MNFVICEFLNFLLTCLWSINLQPLLDIAIYVQKLTGAIGIQVYYYIQCKLAPVHCMLTLCSCLPFAQRFTVKLAESHLA